jgi:protein-disulfide isomerase
LKTALRLFAFLALYLPGPAAHGQQSTAPETNPGSAAASSMQKNIEAYLRHLYAFGPDVKVSVAVPKETGAEGILEVSINVIIGESKEDAKFYVSKDGRFLLRGDMSDMTKDPLAEARSLMQLKDAPSVGDAKAPVTLVEYSDFECPVCKSLHDALRSLLPKYAGKVRIVFKDFPIEQIHPWARTAAIAGRCAYLQDPKAFWKLYDLIYDNQEIISAANAWTKMADYAEQSGLNAETFKTCMAGAEAGAAVDASRANGLQVEVNSTPTVFVNGRRMVGADSHLLEQYINYELSQQQSTKAAEKK